MFKRILSFGIILGLMSPFFSNLLRADDGKTAVVKNNVIELIEDRIYEIADEIVPLVVHIEVIQKYLGTRKRKVSGSGLIVSKDGYILTNNHVVEDATKIEVTLYKDRKKYKARLIGKDELTDIAVLKIDLDKKVNIPKFGKYKDVKVGDLVLAIGNPYGLDGTVSLGIVSAKGRNIRYGNLINEFIQTDAMIDYGSSGGPLVNFKGEVIGINSMGEGRGIGFTIPIDTALKVMNSFIKLGHLERGWLGVFVQAFNRDMAEYMGVPDLTGVLVTGVVKGSPAEKAGIKAGDVICEFDGHKVDVEEDKDINEFRRLIANYKPGTRVKVRIYRYNERKGRGKFITLKVKLAKHPKVEPEKYDTDLGFSVEEITLDTQLKYQLKDTKGVLVTYVERGTPASEAGMFTGEVIVSVDGHKIESIKDLKEILSRYKKERKKKFLIVAKYKSTYRYHLIIPFSSGGKGKK